MSVHKAPFKKIHHLIAVAGLVVGLSACGGGGGGDSSSDGGAAPVNVQNSGSSGGSTSGGSTGGGSTGGASTGSTTLSWTAPVARSDGSPLALSAIGGYRIYYGSISGNYPNQMDITDPTATSFTVSNVPVGTYYFVMTAYDSTGRESVYSPVVSRAVN